MYTSIVTYMPVLRSYVVLWNLRMGMMCIQLPFLMPDMSLYSALCHHHWPFSPWELSEGRSLLLSSVSLNPNTVTGTSKCSINITCINKVCLCCVYVFYLSNNNFLCFPFLSMYIFSLEENSFLKIYLLPFTRESLDPKRYWLSTFVNVHEILIKYRHDFRFLIVYKEK